MGKINVITLCSGYDSQCMAMERICEDFGLSYDLVAWSEIDKYACMAHDAVFPQFKGRNVGDMTKVDWSNIRDSIDLLVYSTPCQSISRAGLQHGFTEGSGTRSSIIWSTLNAIDVLRPKYLLLENVKAMVSKRFMPDFKSWCKALEDRGYTNYAKVLNAKDYGVPQNRERIFLLSTRDGSVYDFPDKIKPSKVIFDVLDECVDEKYRKSISQDTIDFLLNQMDATMSPESIRQIGNIVPFAKFNNPHRGRIYSPFGISPTLNTMQGGGLAPKILLPFGYIRELTPIECFRLMGVSESDIVKIQSAGISKSQQYKLAGNSIVVDVLYHIFRRLFVAE